MTPTVVIQGASVRLELDEPGAPGCSPRRLRAQCGQVGLDHALHELLEADARPPAQALTRPARVADAGRALGGAYERLVDTHVALGVETGAGKGRGRELGDCVRR